MKYEGERVGFSKRRTNEVHRKGLKKVGSILHNQVSNK
jgi:hypothetical protein